LNFQAHTVIGGNPRFTLRASGHPVGIRAEAEGSMMLKVGPVDCRVGEIPIRVAVPFLSGPLRTIGVIGGFSMHVEPFDAEVKAFGVRFDGTVGTDRLACDLEGEVACKMDVDIAGSIPARVTKASIEIASAEDEEAED
jgi:hypothetical protein